MTNQDFQTPADDDDLPMTVRKARQERAAQLGSAPRAQPQPAAGQIEAYPGDAPSGPNPGAYGPESYADTAYDDRVTVTRFDVPFFRLATFFLKAVLAAIPALALLGAILYGLGVVLRLYFPWIVQTEILIRFPN